MKNVNYYRREKGGFVVSTDPALLDEGTVFEFLEHAKWWAGLTHESLDRAIKNSLCFALLEDDRQIGLARVITDRVTYAYLCDVYIAEERRGQGLGSWLIRCVLEHPDVKHLKRVALITHDAQPFYLGLDFRFESQPHSYMERIQ